MKFVRIDPPGSFCSNEAVRDAVKRLTPKTFVDVGCGGGGLSKVLCGMGLSGIGVDFSKEALAIAGDTLAPEIAAGAYRLVEGDATRLAEPLPGADIAVSYMVMEHVEDDVGFARQVAGLTRPGGHVLIAVPGRQDRWSIEDDTVGHLRRYERDGLKAVLERAGLEAVEVWSVAVPTANILLGASSWLIRRSNEVGKIGQTQRAQTETSGIRDIPWKTVFPSWVRIVLNRRTLWPLFVIQRAFYRTNLGLTMMGVGRVPVAKTS